MQPFFVVLFNNGAPHGCALNRKYHFQSHTPVNPTKYVSQFNNLIPQKLCNTFLKSNPVSFFKVQSGFSRATFLLQHAYGAIRAPGVRRE